MGRFAIFALAFLFACLLGITLAEESADELEVTDPEVEDVDMDTLKANSVPDFATLQETAEAAFDAEDEEGLVAVIAQYEELGIENQRAYLNIAVLYEKLSSIMEFDEAAEEAKLKSRDYLEMAQEEAMKEAEAQKADKKARRIARREAKRVEDAAKAKEEGKGQKKGKGKKGAPPNMGAGNTGGILLDGTLAIPAIIAFVGCLAGVAYVATKLGEPVEKYSKPGKAKKAAKESKKAK